MGWVRGAHHSLRSAEKLNQNVLSLLCLMNLGVPIWRRDLNITACGRTWRELHQMWLVIGLCPIGSEGAEWRRKSYLLNLKLQGESQTVIKSWVRWYGPIGHSALNVVGLLLIIWSLISSFRMGLRGQGPVLKHASLRKQLKMHKPTMDTWTQVMMKMRMMMMRRKICGKTWGGLCYLFDKFCLQLSAIKHIF